MSDSDFYWGQGYEDGVRDAAASIADLVGAFTALVREGVVSIGPDGRVDPTPPALRWVVLTSSTYLTEPQADALQAFATAAEEADDDD